MKKKKKIPSIVIISLCLVAAFFAGRLIGKTVSVVNMQALQRAEKSWGLSFQEAGRPPVADAGRQELEQYDAHYIQETEDKVLYLTFDAGYENGHTGAILDALKKHCAPATFFIVGHYLESSPQLVRRMIDEGHIVANHSFHHPDMSRMNEAEIKKELGELEALYEDTFGQAMTKYFRPPQGKYSDHALKIAQGLGYRTFFWSLAYADWDVKKQPSHDAAFEKLTGRVHPGAIVLLHSTSKTNAEILDELLTRWKDMGYNFRSLDDFP